MSDSPFLLKCIAVVLLLQIVDTILDEGQSAGSDLVCLCAADNQRSFSAVLTAMNIDPASSAPLTENRNASTYKDFHEGGGWEYIYAPGGSSTYLYVWNWPLGFPSKQAKGILNCLMVDEDNDSLIGVQILNYTLANASNTSWKCDTDGRASQQPLNEVYMYACRCDSSMKPVELHDGAGQCYRVNGTDNCGGDDCYIDTWHLIWNEIASTACIALRNDTGSTSSLSQGFAYV